MGIDDEKVDLDLVICAYVLKKKNDEIIDTSFAQAETKMAVEEFAKNDATLYSVSYNSVVSKLTQ